MTNAVPPPKKSALATLRAKTKARAAANGERPVSAGERKLAMRAEEREALEAAKQAARVDSENRSMAGKRRVQQMLRDKLESRRTGEPIFAYPANLPEDHKPYWVELVNSRTADFFARSDWPLMMLYCHCAYDIDRLSLLIEEQGEVLMSDKGWPAVNPLVTIRSGRESKLLLLSAKLQAQPTSRHREEEVHGSGRKDKREEEKERAVGALIKYANGDDNLLAGFSGAMQ